MSNVFDFPSKTDDRVPASQALREFADLLEEFEIGGLPVEVAGVALIPELGVALCGNSETGNDGLNTMLDLGKTAIIMQYLNEDTDDEPPVLH
jgi:hypothetical protein